MTATNSTPPPATFRFTVSAHRTATGTAWTELAHRAEDLGYTTLAVPDHRLNQFSPVAALAAAAAVTTTLRVGTQVLCNDLRHPLLLAEELTTLDVLSNGRLEWGMGAGWLPQDFSPFDVPFDDPGTRSERLIEAIDLMRQCFDGSPVTFAGTHYNAQRTQPALPCVQQPLPPLLIGASHERLVRFAGSCADTVHLSPHPRSRLFGDIAATVTVEQSMDTQVEWVREAAADRTNAPLIAATALPVLITDDVDAAARKLSTPTGLHPDQVKVSPHVLLGSIEEICDTLEYRRDRWGLCTWTVPDTALTAFAPVVARLVGH